MTGKRTSRDSTSASITAINLEEDVHSSLSQLHTPILANKKRLQKSRLEPEPFSLDGGVQTLTLKDASKTNLTKCVRTLFYTLCV